MSYELLNIMKIVLFGIFCNKDYDYHSASTDEGNSNYPRKNGGRTSAASDRNVLISTTSAVFLLPIQTPVISHDMSSRVDASIYSYMAVYCCNRTKKIS